MFFAALCLFGALDIVEFSQLKLGVFVNSKIEKTMGLSSGECGVARYYHMEVDQQIADCP